MLQGRSLHRGETTLDELRTLTAGFEYAHTLLDEDLLDADHDALVVDGDLHLPSLDLGDTHVVFLVVTGNLVIDGACADCDDPATGLYVLGNLHAGSVFTTGMLGVQGDLVVARTLAGFYNDYSTIVKGSTRAAVFFPENHYFQLEGEPIFEHVLGGNAFYRVPTSWRDRVRETLKGRELLARVPGLEHEQVPDFSEEELAAEGANQLIDHDALYERVRQDAPVLTD